MAGKRKNVQDDVKLSKTARASKGKKKDEGFIASGDVDRIISLNGGTYAYILTIDGKTHHVRVGSDKYNILIDALVVDEKHGARTRAQLDKLGWRNPCLDMVDGTN
jgi:hypothetical protein